MSANSSEIRYLTPPSVEIKKKKYCRFKKNKIKFVDYKDPEFLKKFRKKDPLQLLEYWSVDFHYDGRVHNPQFSFPKENHTMEKVCRQIVSDTGKIIGPVAPR